MVLGPLPAGAESLRLVGGRGSARDGPRARPDAPGAPHAPRLQPPAAVAPVVPGPLPDGARHYEAGALRRSGVRRPGVHRAVGQRRPRVRPPLRWPPRPGIGGHSLPRAVGRGRRGVLGGGDRPHHRHLPRGPSANATRRHGRRPQNGRGRPRGGGMALRLLRRPRLLAQRPRARAPPVEPHVRLLPAGGLRVGRAGRLEDRPRRLRDLRGADDLAREGLRHRLDPPPGAEVPRLRLHAEVHGLAGAVDGPAARLLQRLGLPVRRSAVSVRRAGRARLPVRVRLLDRERRRGAHIPSLHTCPSPEPGRAEPRGPHGRHYPQRDRFSRDLQPRDGDASRAVGLDLSFR